MNRLESQGRPLGPALAGARAIRVGEGRGGADRAGRPANRVKGEWTSTGRRFRPGGRAIRAVAPMAE